MDKLINPFGIFLLAFALVACDGSDNGKSRHAAEVEKTDGLIVVGFSQIGAESDWRRANTRSMRETFTKEKGYRLILRDAQQKQEHQIAAIRDFIREKVNYIVLAPVTEQGWDDVLGEAKRAGISISL